MRLSVPVGFILVSGGSPALVGPKKGGKRLALAIVYAFELLRFHREEHGDASGELHGDPGVRFAETHGAVEWARSAAKCAA
jgi:hypothetical protein